MWEVDSRIIIWDSLSLPLPTSDYATPFRERGTHLKTFCIVQRTIYPRPQRLLLFLLQRYHWTKFTLHHLRGEQWHHEIVMLQQTICLDNKYPLSDTKNTHFSLSHSFLVIVIIGYLSNIVLHCYRSTILHSFTLEQSLGTRPRNQALGPDLVTKPWDQTS